MLNSKQKLIPILAIVALIGLAAVYLIATPERNGEGNKGGGKDASGTLAAYATGAMANFKPVGGETLADIQFQDGSGAARKLSDFKGRLVLLNLWATWCAPCREEMPALDRLQAKLGAKDFEVVALSVEKDGTELVRKFRSETGIAHLADYIDPTGRASFALKAFGLPTTLLIGPDGKLLGRLVGPAEWDSAQAIALIEAVRAQVGGAASGN